MDIELLKTKNLSDLREIAKLAGIKSVTTYKKAELLDILVNLAEKADAEEKAKSEKENYDTQATARNTFFTEDSEEEQGNKENRLENKDKPKRRGRPRKTEQNEKPEEQEIQPDTSEEDSKPAKKTGRKRIIEYVSGNDAVNEILNTGDCKEAEGVLEVLAEGYGFLRCENYLPGN